MSYRSPSPQSQKKYRIFIGPRWHSFAYDREGMQMLGTIQRGMQIGALAKLEDGNYAQVNGDIIEVLNKSRVEFALQSATGAQPPSAPAVEAPKPPPPTVVIKKRRRLVLPLGS